MSFERIQDLLKEKMGLDTASVGVATVERAVRQRLAACGMQELQAYWPYLSASEVELQELIEAVVVPETWFFRDREAFTTLVRVALQQRSGTNPGAKLRVLSLPCSTGEEPYSIAMALLDAGLLAPDRVRIDAMDISAQAIAFAQRAIYGKNSFRGQDLAFRDRHFDPTAGSYRLHDEVRSQVQFRQGNLFESACLAGTDKYDVIFCRNVLIYFDAQTQRNVVDILANLLGADGWLFTGPSETGLLLERGFVSAKIPLAFAFRKAVPPPKAETKPRSHTAHSSAPTHPRAAAAILRPASAQRLPPAGTTGAASAPNARATQNATQTAPGGDLLAQAQRLADQGRLAEALEQCERYVKEHSTSASGFYLLGLLHDSAGRTAQAIEQYRKAIYLDPAHRDAMVHMATILAKEGDTRGAQRFFDRAKRTQSEGSGK